MKKYFASTVAAFGLTVATAGGALAAPASPTDGNDGVPDLFDAVNILTGSAFTDNDDIVPYKIGDGGDEKFEIVGPDSPMIGLTAGFSNELGYYTDIGAGTVQFGTGTAFSGFGFSGDGTMGDPFAGTSLTPDPTGSVVGFYLESSGDGGNTFYSEEFLNADGGDHMIAYDLTPLLSGPLTVYADFGAGAVEVTFENPILIGWEDIAFDSPTRVSDMDFDDTMFLVDAVPVPLPAGALLLLTALGGIGAAKRLRRKS